MLSHGSRLLSCAALAVLCAGPAVAQTGRITGTVHDTHGGALSGATVRATNQATGAVTRASSATDGNYAIAELAPGTYTVSVALPGLRTLSHRDVQVSAGASVAVDFVLEPVLLAAVTVTAMLREQSIAAVPFAIAAPTSEVLRVRGVENIEQVAQNVPSFSVQNLGPGQSQVAIRGASSGQIARDQPGVKEDVGAYLDEVPISLSLFTPDLDLFDITRVEVLRGPQGTLYGAGSLSGTVRYISNQPELGVSSTFGEVGVNTIGSGASGNTSKLGFNTPVGDKAAFRIVGYSNELAGWMGAVQPNLQVNKDVNGGIRTGLRTALRMVPSSRLTVTPGFVYQKVKMDGWNRIDAFNILANPYTTTRPAVTLGPRQLFTQIQEPYTDEFLLGDVNLKYDLGGGTSLTAISSYTHRYVLVVRDATALTASITGGSIGLPENVYTLDAPLNDATKSRVWTQELRLAGGRDRLKWVVGGFYSNNHRHYGQDLNVAGFEAVAASDGDTIPTAGLRAPKDHLFWSDLDYTLKQGAVFGEGTVGVSERLDVTGGLRYYNFNENRTQIFDGIFGNNNNGTSLVSQPGSTKANGLAPRVIASYKASDALTINAQASRGFRLGGINDPLNYPLCTNQDSITFSGHNSWKDETAWNYEVGGKSQVLGGRGSINVSAFYMNISDLQLTVTAGSCSSRLILNAAKARSQGLEAEFTATPNEHVDVSLSGSFNDAKLQSTLRDGIGNPLPGIVSGNRLPSVPRVQGTAALTYGWPVGHGSRAFVSGSYNYVGSRYTLIDDEASAMDTVNLNSFGANTIGGPLTKGTFVFNPLLPGYSLVNMRAGLTRDAWEVAVFLNNLGDTRALLALDRERGLRARVGYLTNQPRTYGVTLRFNY